MPNVLAILIVPLALGVAPEPVARRVCVLNGAETFSAPRRQARITRSRGAVPPRLDAGTYVTIEGQSASGFIPVKTLAGATAWVAEQAASGRPSLCVPAAVVMSVCDAAPDAVPMHRDFANPTGSPTGWLRRGSLVQVWEYFEDQGRWTFVEHEHRVGFVESRLLCHGSSGPPGADATERFAMTVVPAGSNCYQQHRTRSAAEIHRIIIHNTENSAKSAIATFRQCNPSRPTSAHVVIDRDGRMYRVVEDRYAAFHTGAAHGGMNAISLAIELVATADLRGMTALQERALIDLIRFWSDLYRIDMTPEVTGNSAGDKAYADVEYWDAPVTLHRLVSAGRGTDCPTFVWDDTPSGDAAFFAWRRSHFGARLADR